MIRRAALLSMMVFFLAVSSRPAAAAGDYPPPWPASDVTMTIPAGQGSETDALFALLRDGLLEKTGKKLLPHYVSGRAGADAWSRMVDDLPDGYVVTAVVLPDAFLRSLQPDSGVDLKTMAICHIVAHMPAVLWVAEPNAIANVNDFTDTAAGMNGNFLVAGPGRYSIAQVAARALARETGVRTTYIPYSDTVTAARAALNRQTGAFWGYSPRVTVPDFPAAVFKPLAVAARERMPSLPDVPTFNQAGLNVVQGVYIGLAVPLDTPKITLQEIDEFFAAYVKSPEFTRRAQQLGFTPLSIGMEAVPTFLKEIEADARIMAEDYRLTEQ